MSKVKCYQNGLSSSFLACSKASERKQLQNLWPRAQHAGRSPAVVRLSIDRIEKNIESIESKITKIFKRPKNREDGSDFDDFLTESIVSPWSIFQKFCERPKNYRIDRIDRLDRAAARSIESIAGRRALPKHHTILHLCSSGMRQSPLADARDNSLNGGSL